MKFKINFLKVKHWIGFHGSTFMIYLFNSENYDDMYHHYYARVCIECKRSVEFFVQSLLK